MEPASAYVLATLLALASAFSDGLKALQEKRYEAAIASLTKVCEPDVPGNALREMARFYRAQAHEGARDPAKALADFGAVAQTSGDATLRAEALAAYRRLGGEPAKLLPAVDPRETWNRFRTALQADDKKTYLALTRGPLRDQVLQAAEQPGGPRRTAAFPYLAVGERVGEDADFGRAWVELVYEQARGAAIRIEVEAELDRHQLVWVLLSLRSRRLPAAGGPGGAAPAANAAALGRLGLACLAYLADRRAWPPDLKALPDLKAQWVNPKSGKARDFLYRAGLPAEVPDAATALLGAAPLPVNEQRLVLYADGKTAELPEAAFQALAKQQGWAPRPATALSPQQTAEIQALIQQLGAPQAKDRAAARTRLTELGATALPLLDEHVDDPDVEIRGSVRALLEAP